MGVKRVLIAGMVIQSARAFAFISDFDAGESTPSPRCSASPRRVMPLDAVLARE